MLLDECLSTNLNRFRQSKCMKRGSIMFCPKCGAQNPDGSPFCASCGAQMGQPQQPMQQAPMNQGNKNPLSGFNAQDLMGDFKKNIGDFKSFGIPQFVALGGAALLLISIFLPFVSVKVLGISVSASLLKGGALHWIIAIMIALCSAFVAVTKKGLYMLIQGGIAVVYAIFEGIFQHDTVTSLAAGFYIMLIAAIGIAVGGVLQFLQDKK